MQLPGGFCATDDQGKQKEIQWYEAEGCHGDPILLIIYQDMIVKYKPNRVCFGHIPLKKSCLLQNKSVVKDWELWILAIICEYLTINYFLKSRSSSF